MAKLAALLRSLHGSFFIATCMLALTACDDKTDWVEPGPGDDNDDDDNDDDDSDDPSVTACLAIKGTDNTWSDGSLSIMSLADEVVNDVVASGFYPDAAIAVHDDTLYAVHAMTFSEDEDNADAVRAIALDGLTSFRWQQDLSAGSNPTTIAFFGTKAFVGELTNGIVREIDLAAADEDDHLTGNSLTVPTAGDWDGPVADIGALLVDNGKLYILNQGIDAFVCASEDARAEISVWDAETLAPVNDFGGTNRILLETCNGGSMAIIDNVLYVQTVGSYRYSSALDDGGIEAIDLATGTSLGMILTETQVGDADIYRIVPTESGDGFWIIVGSTTLYHVSTDGTLSEPLLTINVLNDVAEYDGTLYIADGTLGVSGIQLLDVASGERITTEAIPTAYNPNRLALYEVEGDSCL